jgi:hypothetical protein
VIGLGAKSGRVPYVRSSFKVRLQGILVGKDTACLFHLSCAFKEQWFGLDS